MQIEQQLYDELISTAKARASNRKDAKLLLGYCEGHHTIPLCMDGPDTKDNIVFLMAEEHFRAHKLLYALYPEHLGIFRAYRATCYKNKELLSEEEFGRLRRNHLAGGVNHPRFGKSHSERTRKLMSEQKKGVPLPKEWAENIKKNHAGRGKKRSPEVRNRISLTKRTKPRIEGTCPRCGFVGNLNATAFKQWHFNNCKFKEKVS